MAGEKQARGPPLPGPQGCWNMTPHPAGGMALLCPPTSEVLQLCHPQGHGVPLAFLEDKFMFPWRAIPPRGKLELNVMKRIILPCRCPFSTKGVSLTISSNNDRWAFPDIVLFIIITNPVLGGRQPAGPHGSSGQSQPQAVQCPWPPFQGDRGWGSTWSALPPLTQDPWHPLCEGAISSAGLCSCQGPPRAWLTAEP